MKVNLEQQSNCLMIKLIERSGTILRVREEEYLLGYTNAKMQFSQDGSLLLVSNSEQIKETLEVETKYLVYKVDPTNPDKLIKRIGAEKADFKFITKDPDVAYLKNVMFD